MSIEEGHSAPRDEESSFRARLLGGFDLWIGEDRLSALASGRAQSLLGYLLLHRDAPQPRQQIAVVLWPDSTDSQARTNLRNLLHYLRRTIPGLGDYLEVDTTTIAWRDRASVDVDVADFEAAADRGLSAHGAEALAALEQAVELYQGDLLPGSYEEWLLPEQERLRARFLEVLHRLVAVYEDTADRAGAIRSAERLLRHDPLHEDTYRRLIELHAANGDRARALRTYHACATTLQQELGVAPDAATQAAYEAVLNRDEPPPQTGRPHAATAGPLLGRDAEWVRLMEAWHTAVEGRPQLVLVSGEPGIGKTRLLEELVRWSRQQRVLVATARSYEAEGALPYAPVVEWLRSDALRHRLDDLGPQARADMSRLLPELAPHAPARDPSEALSEEEQRRRLHDVIARILQVERPMLLVADDLQWCDRNTLEVIHYLVRADRDTPLMIAGSVRREEVEGEHPLHSVAAGLIRVDRCVEIALERLSPSETARLGAQLAERDMGADADDLFRETEGNPLFIIETIRAGWTGPADGSFRWLTPKVQAVIEDRLAHLSGEARQLVDIAAAIGREFTLDVLTRACDVEEDTMVPALDELWHRRILRDKDIDAYDFSHDKIREVAYAAIPLARRRRIHLHVAKALEHIHARNLDEVATRIGGHYERAGARDEAVSYYERAVGAAKRVFADNDAITLARRALHLLSGVPESPQRDERELSLLLALGATLFSSQEEYTETRAVYERAREICRRYGRSPDPPIMRVMGNFAIVRRDYGEAYALGRELRESGEAAGDRVAEVEGHYLTGVAAFWLGRLEVARTELDRAVALYDPERRREHIESFGHDPKAICLARLAFALWHLGEVDRAVELREQAVAYAREIAHPYTLGYALVFDVWLSVETGETQRATESLEGLEGVRVFNAVLQSIRAALEGWLRTCGGDPGGGITHIRQTLEEVRESDEILGEPLALLLLAQAKGLHGDPHGGLEALKQARTMCLEEMPYHAAEFHRLRGELLAAPEGDPAEIERAFEEAVRIAREQSALSLELRARMSMLRWRRSVGADVAGAEQALREVYDRFSQGLWSRDLKDTSVLLDGAQR